MFDMSSILMLHRVGNRNPLRIPANQNMLIEPDEISDFVSAARKKRYAFVSMDEIAEALILGKVPKKTFALTFDDGYLDNFTLAYPLLKSLDVPFCIYLTTGFIGRPDIPWWYRLEELLRLELEITTPEGRAFDLSSVEFENAAFMDIRSRLMSESSISNIYKDWLDGFSISELFQGDRIFMNWLEIDVLNRDRLVTLGAHTCTHPVLSKLSDGESYSEIKDSKNILEKNLGVKVNHLAFPFGGNDEISRREFSFAEEIGFSSAVTTRYGGLRAGKSQDLFKLPRIFFGPGVSPRRLQLDLQKKLMKDCIKNFARGL